MAEEDELTVDRCRIPAEDLVRASSPRLSRETQDQVAGSNLLSSEDPDNYPLHSSWSFWFHRSPKGSDSGDFFANLRHLANVSTIKAFWCVFNNLPPSSSLIERDSYHLMRGTDRRPVWEDADNADGGLWTFKFHKDFTVQLWQEVLLAVIGEQLSRCVHEDDDICGASLSVRHETNILQIWHLDAAHQHQAKVFEKLQELVPNVSFKTNFYQTSTSKVKESITRSTSRGRSPHPSPHRPHYNPGPPSYGPMRTGPIMGTGPMTHGQPRASSSSRPMAPAHPSVVHRYSSPVNQTGVLGPLPVPALVPPVLVPGPPSVPLSQSHSSSLRQKSPAFEAAPLD